MDFPRIFEDFNSMDDASFDFDDFLYGMSDTDVVQSSVGTSATAGTIETTGTSGGASPCPSSSQRDPSPHRLFRGDLIPIVHSLKTYAWTIHRHQVSSCLFLFLALLFAQPSL